MVRGRAGDKSETSGAARRAWLAGLLVWTLVVQLLVPALGPLRLGDGTATAALGRMVPICTIEGLRLPEPATSDTRQGGEPARIDAGWHCQLCLTPAAEPPAAAAAAPVLLEWRQHWLPPAHAGPAEAESHRPQSARGPPLRS